MILPRLSQLALIVAFCSTIEAQCPVTQPDCTSSGSNDTWPVQTYRSTSVTAPNLTITGNGGSLSPGYAFFDNYIMTPQNQLIYAAPNASATNFHVQTYNGAPYLTYWTANATGTSGYGYGSLTLLDSSYVATTLCMDLGLTSYPVLPRPVCQFDAHEQAITERNTLLVTGYNYTTADLSSIGGPKDGYILDSHFFEIDIATQEILFSWDAAEHVPVSASHLPLSDTSSGTADAPYDFFHVNSLELVGEDYLVNSRHTWTTFLISGVNGSILWTFNATGGGSFGPEAANYPFSWQHFARVHNRTENTFALSLFANNNFGTADITPTTGLVYELSLPPSKEVAPKLLRSLEVPSEDLYAGSQGNYEVDVLATGNQFMGYGQVPVMREYGPATDGSDLRWEARFNYDGGLVSYRAYKQEWSGMPRDWDPSLVIVKGRNGENVAEAYVSWNGATDVREWIVYTGRSEAELQARGTRPVSGFETVFAAPSSGCVVVEAVLGEGTRRSNVVCN